MSRNKNLFVLFLVTMMMFAFLTPVKAENNSLKEDELITEHTQIIHTEDGFEILVPTEEDPYGFIPVTRASIVSAIVTFFVVTGSVLGACDTIEFLSEWNPCVSAKSAIISHVKKMKLINGSHKYRISRQWIAGKIPGCQPMYSGVCNTGYYKYTFTRIN